MRNFLLKRGVILAGDDWRYGCTRSSELLELIQMLKPKFFGIPLVRLGGKADGSYLVPDDFIGVGYCLSPGYGEISGFEDDLFRLHSIRSYVIDPKVPENYKNDIDFTEGYLGFDANGIFFGLDSWVEQLGLELDDDKSLLQMDIEGAEWDVLLCLQETLIQKFRCIIIEFHQLELMLNRQCFERVHKRVFEKLNRYFDVVHVHPNNAGGTFPVGRYEFPRILEITFHNKRRRIQPHASFPTLPSSLDEPSRNDLPDLLIDKRIFS